MNNDKAAGQVLEITEKYKDVKQITSLTSKLSKETNIYSSSSLANLTNLAYWLYIIPNDVNRALSLCDMIKEIKFDGNYNKWTWIEALSQLGAFINEELGNDTEVNFYKQKIGLPLVGLEDNKLEFHLRIINRKLNDVELYNKEIANAILNGDMEGELEYRKGQIWKYMYIYVVGRSEVYSNDELLVKINSNIDIIRAKINNKDV